MASDNFICSLFGLDSLVGRPLTGTEGVAIYEKLTHIIYLIMPSAINYWTLRSGDQMMSELQCWDIIRRKLVESSGGESVFDFEIQDGGSYLLVRIRDNSNASSGRPLIDEFEEILRREAAECTWMVVLLAGTDVVDARM